MMKGKVEKVEKQGKDEGREEENEEGREEGRGMKKVHRGFLCS